MKDAQVTELLLQALETELGGTKVYMTAIKCTTNKDLKQEFTEYLDQTRRHVEIVKALLVEFGLDPKATSPGREVVRRIGRSLVGAMQKALAEGPPEAAQLVAAECVTLAETKDHLNWELIGEVAGKVKGERGKALKSAYKEVEEQEDEHLYHSAGWARELWVKSLGLPRCSSPAGGKKGRKDRYRCRPGQAGSRTDSEELNGRPVDEGLVDGHVKGPFRAENLVNTSPGCRGRQVLCCLRTLVSATSARSARTPKKVPTAWHDGSARSPGPGGHRRVVLSLEGPWEQGSFFPDHSRSHVPTRRRHRGRQRPL